jgi:fusaric acid resistance family protein
MAAALASYVSVLWLAHVAHLQVDVVVLSVVLAVTLGRTVQRADWVDRAVGSALVPTGAVGASEIGRLMADRVVVGSTLFATAVAATIFVRRWGPRCTTAGVLVTAPLLAVLIVPALPIGRTNVWWSAVVALIAYAWTVACFPSGRVEGEPPRLGRPRKRVSARMALQMGVALGVAFAAGHLVFGEHWAWVALTAFVVCSGNRGRRDVARKSVLRVAGATAGTAVATLLTGLFGPADPWQVVAIFGLLAIGTWLRPLSYAYWAAAVTAALAFLYGYFGQTSPTLLTDRLGAILLGGLIGVTVSWFLLPVRDGITKLPPWLARACAMASQPIRRGPRPP